MKFGFLFVGIVALILAAGAEASPCASPTAIACVAVPGHPFAVAATADNCWLFVTVDAGKDHGAVAVLHNQDGNFALDHVWNLKGNGYGESLSHDGQVLAVSAGDDTVLLDVAGLERGANDSLLGMLHDGRDAGAVYTVISRDDKLLFVSDEQAQRISVFDLAKARSGGFHTTSPIGHIPLANAPVGLALSPDGYWLYATSQVALASSRLSPICKPETHDELAHPVGMVFRIDVGKAKTDPAHAVLAALPAGCNPVRVAVSPSGAQLWITARGDSTLLRYQIDGWLSGTRQAAVTRFPVGASPVGVVVRPDGKQVWMTLSNRFGGDEGGRLAGLETTADGPSLRLMSVAAAGFPREVIFLADGRSLVATRFDAKQVEFIPVPD